MQRRKTLLVGSGPANLALLTCLKERGSSVLDSLEVLERRDSAEWHPGIAFEDSMLQVSLFKDLAFLRNPASPFTFFSFLRDKELLDHFIHTNNLYPSRKLFSDYLVWVSRFFANKISFGKEAVAVRFHEKPSGTQTLVVMTRDVSSGDVSEIEADDVVVSLGHEPYIPEELAVDSGRVVHSNFFLSHANEGMINANARIAVVGSGQSAGEIVRFLLQHREVSEVIVVGRRHLFEQTDDNPFVNDFYTYPHSLKFAELPLEDRKRFLSDTRNTNFSTVTKDVLKSIYDLRFEDQACGRDRLRLFPYTEITAAKRLENGLRLDLRGIGGRPDSTTLEIELLVCATGFSNRRHLSFFQLLQPRMEDADVVVDESFEVGLDQMPESCFTGPRPRVFLVNHSFGLRGLTEHTLGGLAERAAVVAKALQDGHVLQPAQGRPETLPAAWPTGNSRVETK
ncbi:hypothetical protein B5V01_22210 [Mesorhizobium erdmanii]|uniref:SidA/IucD/PvdA family monooxygenase n=2 Tax=Mesorhizobium TaxID=68287 RepID=A0A3M9X4T6_9HYPH|nr:MULTISPECIES: SidA/IucD/PvdA family monooxygenase [Mesorhizobium]RNJ42732.1 hypothetical protein DNR46_26835 [Mesorhizobium japonicum]RXT42597.1 hypothetical protein B5V01_22210 [Mesorhizobium erdmanii]